MTTDVPRLEPWPGPINQEYYDGLKRHELLLQKCTDCGKFRFWPIEMCPFCNSFNYEWARCSGKGTVHSYTIQHATMPYPWPVLLVELEEGPRLITHGLMSPEEVYIGMPVEVDFEKISDNITLHAFKKAE
ncbi:MAG: OB-fold domain-containing protein [Dehalococcoidia bacterium]|nr:MAG: OB-fold domain-containing protein [Dehalococcoidia bacterium]UCG84491.1 MAG: OB-fold domain-containing protein [Dehalococcoidia bacterium]